MVMMDIKTTNPHVKPMYHLVLKIARPCSGYTLLKAQLFALVTDFVLRFLDLSNTDPLLSLHTTTVGNQLLN
jgi:hypothetical protein